MGPGGEVLNRMAIALMVTAAPTRHPSSGTSHSRTLRTGVPLRVPFPLVGCSRLYSRFFPVLVTTSRPWLTPRRLNSWSASFLTSPALPFMMMTSRQL